MALPDRLPADAEHGRDDRPADTAAGEPVDLRVDEQLRATRVRDQLNQTQRPRISDRRTRGRGRLPVLTFPSALTSAHPAEPADTRPHRCPHEVPDESRHGPGAGGDARGDASLLVRAAHRARQPSLRDCTHDQNRR
jgi:hypothetical protein